MCVFPPLVMGAVRGWDCAVITKSNVFFTLSTDYKINKPFSKFIFLLIRKFLAKHRATPLRENEHGDAVTRRFFFSSHACALAREIPRTRARLFCPQVGGVFCASPPRTWAFCPSITRIFMQNLCVAVFVVFGCKL